MSISNVISQCRVTNSNVLFFERVENFVYWFKTSYDINFHLFMPSQAFPVTGYLTVETKIILLPSFMQL